MTPAKTKRMTWTTSSVNDEARQTAMTPATETDSFPRISARDLFLVLRVFDQNAETSLENIRLRICVDRKSSVEGLFFGLRPATPLAN